MREHLLIVLTLCLVSAARADNCLVRNPITDECISSGEEPINAPNEDDPAALWGDVRRGPFGGVVGIPDGYYVCALYDFDAKRCLVRAPTEEEMESATDLAIRLTREMQQRQGAIVERDGIQTPSQRPNAFSFETGGLGSIGDAARAQSVSVAAAPFEACVNEKMVGKTDAELMQVLQQCDK